MSLFYFPFPDEGCWGRCLEPVRPYRWLTFHCLGGLLFLLPEVLKIKAGFIRETSTRLAKQMLQNRQNQYQYLGVLKKIIADARRAVQSSA
jgi:hypothetical protein